LLPGITFNPSFTRTGSLFQNPISGLGSGSGQTPLTSISPCSLGSLAQEAQAAVANAATSPLTNVPRDFRFVQTQYLVPLNLNYEVDLWSRLNNTYLASLILAQAASQAYLSVLLSLTADVATAYFQIRGLDAQQEVLQGNIRIRQHAVDLSRARYNAGLIVY